MLRDMPTTKMVEMKPKIKKNQAKSKSSAM